MQRLYLKGIMINLGNEINKSPFLLLQKGTSSNESNEVKFLRGLDFRFHRQS